MSSMVYCSQVALLAWQASTSTQMRHLCHKILDSPFEQQAMCCTQYQDVLVLHVTNCVMLHVHVDTKQLSGRSEKGLPCAKFYLD